MPDYSSTFSLPVPKDTETPDMPQAMWDYTNRLEPVLSGIKGNADLAPSSFRHRTDLPSDLNTQWLGQDMKGFYQFPTATDVAKYPSLPAGANGGDLFVNPVTANISLLEFREWGQNARTWQKTSANPASGSTAWRQINNNTKNVALSLTLSGGATIPAYTEYNARLPLMSAARSVRWRFHFRNFNVRDGVNYTGAISIPEIWIGKANADAEGKMDGSFSNAVKVVSDFTLPENGFETTTPWIDNFPIEPNQKYIISYGATALTSGMEFAGAQGGGWVTTTAADASNPDLKAPQVKTQPLMIFLEMEVPIHTPVIGAVGDSLTVGHSSSLPVFDSWVAKYARSRGAVPLLYAASGDAITRFMASAGLTYKYIVYKNYARPDVIYYAMGSNDIFGANVPLETMKTNLVQSLSAVRQIAGENIVLCSIWPRLVGDEPAEEVRKQYNEWLRTTLPGNANFYLDTAQFVTAADGKTLDRTWTASYSDIHLSTAGYARVAAALGSGAV